jgi:diguanylate cyclase (GGDEF)-like protein
MRVSVNVSARQLTPALVSFVSRTLTRTSIHPSQLALEITETLLIEQAASSRSILESLKQLGVGVVLDDFGTGYSSLSYLKSFPLDQLKVDRSFIAELSDDTRSAKIVSATVEMARALGMTVVAEGVETPAQLEILQRLGCDYAQGYHFAAPAPAPAIARRIEEAARRQRPASGEPRRGAMPVPDPDASMHGPEETDRRRREAVGRVAGALFCIGGVLAIPSGLIVDRAPSPLVVAGLSLLGLCSGAICLLLPWRRLSWHWIHATALLATAEVALSVWALGHAAVFSWYYVLIAAAVGYAFSDRRTLAAYILIIALALAAPLVYIGDPTGDGVPRTLLEIGVIAATVALVAWLREQLESNQAELRELAARDPLTGVGNYRLLHERLEYELRRHQRSHKQLAVLLIDLDRFKQVNERLGHAAGDDVLRRVARAMCGAVRQQDTVARQGGDEFAVLAPETDAEGALTLAARICDRVSEVRIDGETMGATIGFSIYPGDGGSTNVLLARADARMLADKSRARPRPASEPGNPEPAREGSDLVGADLP